MLRDIAALTEHGCDIILHPDNKLGFYIGSRTFEDWELKILMDSVQSSRFLTAEQTKSLTERISRLSSAAGCKALRRLFLPRFRTAFRERLSAAASRK